MLKITNIHVFYQKQAIVRGVDLEVRSGEIVILMGPNGSGKSTLANSLLGHPSYSLKQGKILLDGKDITALPPEKKVAKGLFLAWQNPLPIPGISLNKLLRELKVTNTSLTKDLAILRREAKYFAFSEGLLIRSLNDGFSGGEKKKVEMLQAVHLAKKYVIFDEIDTGLDVDALKKIAEAINKLKSKGLGILVITHYHGLIRLLELDRVIIMSQGKIQKEGGRELATEVERKGYGDSQ